jgi:sulfur-carrier protein adenylyltransferase/sulfurtransferase
MSTDPLFVPIPQVSAAEARKYFDTRDAATYTLLDVRQPEEYEAGHLPGARLLPVGELSERLGEVDRARAVFTYCRLGGRGGRAAATLVAAGFEQVHNLQGGLEAWEGTVAVGSPATAMAVFSQSRTVEEHIALAWHLEEGARVFYEEQARRFSAEPGAEPAAELFRAMARSEVEHARMLHDFHERRTGSPVLPAIPPEAEGLMEGGVLLAAALAWARLRGLAEVLDYCAAVEANAYDRYLSLAVRYETADSYRVFRTMAQEEKAHLDAYLRALIALPPSV